ncbi:MAG: flagellar basal body P-ring formation protein FlgA [Burkholderiaceae bacterium]|nr:flagellar basal body P-ring formation protein FlgA [Burkholderiaceae bacterium]
MLRRFIFLLLCLLALPGWAAIRVTLQPYSEARQRYVTLGDIARVESSDAKAPVELLEQTRVHTLQHVDQPAQVDAKPLLALLERLHPALKGELKIDGAPSARVVLKGQQLAPQAVTQALAAYATAEIARLQPRFRLASIEARTEPLQIPRGRWELVPKAFHAGASVEQMSILAEIRVDGMAYEVVRVPLAAVLYAPALRVSRALRAGDQVQPKDVVAVEAPVQQLQQDFAGMEGLANARLRRDKPSQSMLLQGELVTPPLVRRDQTVQAEFRSAGVVVEKSLTALGDAKQGQTLKVLDPATRQIHSALVVSAGRVEIR